MNSKFDLRSIKLFSRAFSINSDWSYFIINYYYYNIYLLYKRFSTQNAHIFHPSVSLLGGLPGKKYLRKGSWNKNYVKKAALGRPNL